MTDNNEVLDQAPEDESLVCRAGCGPEWAPQQIAVCGPEWFPQ